MCCRILFMKRCLLLFCLMYFTVALFGQRQEIYIGTGFHLNLYEWEGNLTKYTPALYAPKFDLAYHHPLHENAYLSLGLSYHSFEMAMSIEGHDQSARIKNVYYYDAYYSISAPIKFAYEYEFYRHLYISGMVGIAPHFNFSMTEHDKDEFKEVTDSLKYSPDFFGINYARLDQILSTSILGEVRLIYQLNREMRLHCFACYSQGILKIYSIDKATDMNNYVLSFPSGYSRGTLAYFGIGFSIAISK